MHKYSETSMPNFRGIIKFLLVHWPLEVYGYSLCRHPAPVCPTMDEIRYNSTENSWQNEKILEMHQKKQNCLKISSFTAIDHHNSALSMTHRCASRWYTTIENPSYFFMTLSCTEAIQSFSSHFNQYSLVDPSWGHIPSWGWQGISHWFRKLWSRVWHQRHFENWISWK